MLHAQAKLFPKNKKFEPYEVYENSPQDVLENELVPVVNLGVKNRGITFPAWCRSVGAASGSCAFGGGREGRDHCAGKDEIP
jgi:hypothetical protein